MYILYTFKYKKYILYTFKWLLIVDLSLTIPGAKQEHIHQFTEGLDREAGQRHKRVGQSNGMKQPSNLFILTKVVKKSVIWLLWKLINT